MLIILGDVVDGKPGICDVKKTVELLLKVKNRILVLGNHDKWFLDFLDVGKISFGWYSQGGKETLYSYGFLEVGYDEFRPEIPIVKGGRVPPEHEQFFINSVPYWLDDEGRVFVHGGLVPGVPMEDQVGYDLLWDRELINYARDKPVPGFKHVFVGHTTTQLYGADPKIKNCCFPLTFNNLTMMDTGAGWSGRLSMKDIDTGEVWQSDHPGN